MTPPRGAFRRIDEYIRAFPGDVGRLLERMRQAIREEAPEAVEAISYQMPTFKLKGRSLVHFAAFTNHIGFYPLPSGIEAFKQELAPYKQGKGSVQFPLDEPLPLELVRKIVRYRVQQNLRGGKR